MSEVALAQTYEPRSAPTAVRALPAAGLGQAVTGEILKGAHVHAREGSKVGPGQPLTARESRAGCRMGKPGPALRVQQRAAEPDGGAAAAIVGQKWIPWIFAAKMTAAGLLALLVAFTFNLDQPRWALITVLIVAQPQSGLVLAKSFYRIIGTLLGERGLVPLDQHPSPGIDLLVDIDLDGADVGAAAIERRSEWQVYCICAH
jgi:Fusaric acid resistance protein family